MRSERLPLLAAGVLGAGLVIYLATRARSRALGRRAWRAGAPGRAAWHDPVSRASAWSSAGEPAVPGLDGLRTGPHGRLVVRRRAGVLSPSSPNEAERLEAANAFGSPVGAGTPMAASGSGDELFGSSSRDGPEPEATGLADFTRGA